MSSSTDNNWNADAANIVRDMIKYESELVNHRISWLVTLQGLLFAALGFAWQSSRALIYLIAALGIATSLSTYSVLRLGTLASRKLLTEWDANKPIDYNGPDVIGYRAEPNWSRFFRPWRFLPFLFVAAWVAVCVINSVTARP